MGDRQRAANPLRIVIGLAALVGLAVGASPGRAAVDWADPDVQAVRKMIERGDWGPAYEFSGQHMKRSGATGALFRSLRQILSVVHLRLEGNEYYLRLPTDAPERANAATMVGLYDQAIRLYEEGIEDEKRSTSARPDGRPRYLFQAARCAVRLHDYAKAVAYLTAIEDLRQYRRETETQARVALLNGFTAEPNNIAYRLGMVREFLLGQDALLAHFNMAAPDFAAYEDDLRFLRETLKLDPTREQVQQIYSLIVKLAEKSGDPATVEQTLETAAREFRGEDFGAVSALQLADLYESRDPARAERCLRDVASEYADTYWAAEAHYRLGDLACKAGNTDLMVEHLEAAARGPEEKPRAAEDAVCHHPRYTAHAWLADHYRRQGDFERALDHYQEWVPQHFCGNALAGAYAYRDWRIAECLVGLGSTQQALDECLMPRLTDDTMFLSPDCEGLWGIAKLLVDIYEQRGQLEAIPDLMQPYLRETSGSDMLADLLGSPPGVDAVTLLAQYRMWARDKDLDRLFAALQPHDDGSACLLFHDYGQSYYRGEIAAAEALAGIGGAAFAPLKAKFEELMAAVDSADPDKDYCHRAMVAYALGLSPPPAARAYLEELLRKAEETPDPTSPADTAKAFAAFGITKDDLESALSLRESDR